MTGAGAAKRTASNRDRGGERTLPPAHEDRSGEDLMAELAAGRPVALRPLHGRYAAVVFVWPPR
jgi:hypothetical protein